MWIIWKLYCIYRVSLQYLDAKYDLMEHVTFVLRHIHVAPNAVCNHTKTGFKKIYRYNSSILKSVNNTFAGKETVHVKLCIS